MKRQLANALESVRILEQQLKAKEEYEESLRMDYKSQIEELHLKYQTEMEILNG